MYVRASLALALPSISLSVKTEVREHLAYKLDLDPFPLSTLSALPRSNWAPSHRLCISDLVVCISTPLSHAPHNRFCQQLLSFEQGWGVGSSGEQMAGAQR